MLKALKYIALLALLGITPAAAQDHNWPTPGNAIVPGYVTMCIVANVAVPCAAGGGVTSGTTTCTSCTAGGVLFNNAGVVTTDAGLTKAAGATGAVTFGGNINLPNTAAGPIGVINFGGATFLHNAGSFDNVFLGSSAGNLTATGTRNVVIGESAGVGLTSGANNIFVGRFSGGQVQTTGNNVAVGTSTLSGGTSLANSTAVGFGALGSATGINNTALGATAGSTILGGTGNVIIGQGSTPGITTGTNNTIIGSGVTGLATGLSSAVVIAANGNKADFGVTVSGEWSLTGGVNTPAMTSTGTPPTGNTGTCSTGITVAGGATAGTWTSTAVCALGGTIILTAMPTQPNGYACFMTDRTTNGVTINQSATTATTATFIVRSLPTGSVATVANDILQYHCMGY